MRSQTPEIKASEFKPIISSQASGFCDISKLEENIEDLKPFYSYHEDNSPKVEFIIKNLVEICQILAIKNRSEEEKNNLANRVSETRRVLQIFMEKEEEDTVQELRRLKFQNELCSYLFDAQILLAYCYPLNMESDWEANVYIDPISLEELPNDDDDEVVATSAGYLILKQELTHFFSGNTSFQVPRGTYSPYSFRVRGDRTYLLHPVPRADPITQREQAYLRSQGVVIPEVVSKALQTGRSLGISGELPFPLTGRLRLDVNPADLNGYTYGYLLGLLIGVIITIGLLLAFPVSIFSVFTLVATSTIAGAIDKAKNDGSFRKVFLHTALSSIIITSILSLALPYLMHALLVYAATSPPIIAAITSTWALIQPFFPGLILAIGVISECFKPRALADIFSSGYRAAIQIPSFAFGIIGARIGWITKWRCWGYLHITHSDSSNQDAEEFLIPLSSSGQVRRGLNIPSPVTPLPMDRTSPLPTQLLTTEVKQDENTNEQPDLSEKRNPPSSGMRRIKNRCGIL